MREWAAAQPASGLLRAGCVACCFAGDERAVGDVSIETIADSPSMAILTAAKDSEPASAVLPVASGSSTLPSVVIAFGSIVS